MKEPPCHIQDTNRVIPEKAGISVFCRNRADDIHPELSNGIIAQASGFRKIPGFCCTVKKALRIYREALPDPDHNLPSPDTRSLFRVAVLFQFLPGDKAQNDACQAKHKHHKRCAGAFPRPEQRGQQAV